MDINWTITSQGVTKSLPQQSGTVTLHSYGQEGGGGRKGGGGHEGSAGQWVCCHKTVVAAGRPGRSSTARAVGCSGVVYLCPVRRDVVCTSGQ